jgi:hypothetical protein
MIEKLIVLILFILYSYPSIGQSDCCWFNDKPVTTLDSQIINKENVKQISIYYCYSIDTTIRKILHKTIQIDSCKKEWCFDVIKERVFIDRIIQKVKSPNGYTPRDVFRLTHYKDSTGKITITKIKQLKGRYTEDKAYDKILYKYSSNGLLASADYYSELFYGIDSPPFMTIIYEYIK